MPLSYSFLRRYGKCVNADMRQLTIGRYVTVKIINYLIILEDSIPNYNLLKSQHPNSRYALELSLQEYQYITYRPSQLAAAALLFSMKKTGNHDWDITCQHYSQFKEGELTELVLKMDRSAVSAAGNRHCKTIYKKYSHKVFFEVALLPQL